MNRILKKKVETESSYAAPKGPRFGKWTDASDLQARRDEQLIAEMSKPPFIKVEEVVEEAVQNTPPESMIEDTEMGEAGPMQKIKTQKFVQAKPVQTPSKAEVQTAMEKMGKEKLKQETRNEFNLDVIQARFLRTPISNAGGLTNGNIIATLPMFRSAVRGIIKDSVEQDAANPRTVKVGSIGVRDKTLRKAYICSTPKARVQIAGGGRYKALLDTGAEVNVMTHSIVKEEGLAMRPYPDVNLVSHSGERRPFLGVCEDVEISIGGVKGMHHVFVIEAADHQLVLGQPFLLQMRVELTYVEGEIKCTLHSEDGTRTAEFTVGANTSQKSQTIDDLFVEHRLESLN